MLTIRLYLYGNKLSSLSGWSKLLIETEKDMMNDEDNWSTFLENDKYRQCLHSILINWTTILDFSRYFTELILHFLSDKSK
jgi:hypothetical protein